MRRHVFYSFPQTSQGIQVIAGSEKFSFERQFYKSMYYLYLAYCITLHCIVFYIYILYGTVTKVEHLWAAINANLSSIVSK